VPVDGCSTTPSFVCNLQLYADCPGDPFLDEIALPMEGPSYPTNTTVFVPTLDLANVRCD
jgi:hypothetical protein